MFHRYKCIKQHDEKDCGVACIAMICKHYGLLKSIAKIRSIAGTDKGGTSAFGIVKCFEKLGFAAKGIRVQKAEDLFSSFPKPCIAHVVEDGKMLHYVVLYSVNKKRIIIADPAKGVVKLSPDDFFKIWTGVLLLATPDANFIKGNETKNMFQRFFVLLKPQQKLLFHIFIASLLYTILSILSSFYFKIIMDEILPNDLLNTLWMVSIGIILLNIFKSILDSFRNYLLYILSQKLDIPLIFGFYRHVLKLPMDFFGTRKVGEIITRFMDASKIRDAISSAALTLMIDTIMAVAGGIILYLQSSLLFYITIIILILYGIIVISFNGSLKKTQQQGMEQNAQLTSYIVESLSGIQTVKSFSAENQAEANTEEKFIKFLRITFKNNIIINWQKFLTSILSSVGITIILWVGTYSVLNGNLTIGSLLTFYALLAYFFNPIQSLINLQPQLQTAIVASDRLGEIFDLESEEALHGKTKISPNSLKGDIEIKHVDFRYGTRQLILKDINISIKSGQSIAFVGESGSGKTTLSKLILDFYTPEKGEILINGMNIKDLDLSTLRRHIGYISQETFLFSGTILDNFKLANPDVTLEDIIEVCKLTKAHDFINEFPLRYDTYLEENAMNLSGGQKQRLSIARALIKHPDILIMDEATSSLDSVTEKAIEDMIKKISNSFTTITIAHRLSTIVSCDCIYVMDKGIIKESGSHEQLLSKKGIYYTLWMQQTNREGV